MARKAEEPQPGPRIEIRNWTKFQHYKDRSPPWVKLHKTLLDDRAWHALSGDASKLLAECWLLASDHPEGWIEMNTADLAWRLRRPDVPAVARMLEELARERLIVLVGHDASAVLAPCKRHARPETEAEGERETEGTVDKSTEAVAPKIEQQPDIGPTLAEEHDEPVDDHPDIPTAAVPDASAELRATIPPAVRDILWRAKTVPDRITRTTPGWDMGREIDIAKKIVSTRRATLEELIGAISVARGTLGNMGDPLTLRIFNQSGRNDPLAVCIAAWRQQEGRRKLVAMGGMQHILRPAG
jgi:hypothetical protein